MEPQLYPEPSVPDPRTTDDDCAYAGKGGDPITPDERLLAAYAEGDERGLAALVERYAQELHRFVMRYVGDAATAEDVVQETFLQVHLSADTFDPERRFRPWLFTIAVNKARDLLRSRARKREVSLSLGASMDHSGENSYLDFLSEEAVGPVTEVETEEQRRLVRDVVAKMPDHLREILMLSYFQHLPYKELAEVLAIPLGTVKSRLHAAVSHFATAYRRAAGQA